MTTIIIIIHNNGSEKKHFHFYSIFVVEFSLFFTFVNVICPDINKKLYCKFVKKCPPWDELL